MKIRTKKRICVAVGLTLLLLTLGIVGGMDMGIMPIGRGAVLALTSEAVGTALLWKGGVIRVR